MATDKKETEVKKEEKEEKKTTQKSKKAKDTPKVVANTKPITYTLEELCDKFAYKKTELVKIYIINNIDLNSKLTLYEAKTKLNL